MVNLAFLYISSRNLTLSTLSLLMSTPVICARSVELSEAVPVSEKTSCVKQPRKDSSRKGCSLKPE